MNLLDTLPTLPLYFYSDQIGPTNENLNFDLSVQYKGLICELQEWRVIWVPVGSGLGLRLRSVD